MISFVGIERVSLWITSLIPKSTKNVKLEVNIMSFGMVPCFWQYLLIISRLIQNNREEKSKKCQFAQKSLFENDIVIFKGKIGRFHPAAMIVIGNELLTGKLTTFHFSWVMEFLVNFVCLNL